MKHLLSIFYLLFVCSYLLAQPNSVYIREVDLKVDLLEKNSKMQIGCLIDSSKRKFEPFTANFYSDMRNNKLAKVEFVVLKPSIKLVYYFSNDKLIKVIGVDKSTSETLDIVYYFKDEKVFYGRPRPVDGPSRTGEYLLKKSKEYLSLFTCLK